MGVIGRYIPIFASPKIAAVRSSPHGIIAARERKYAEPQYESHAIECKLDIPKVPIIFHKPATALSDPWPASTIIPKHTIGDESADYEAELVVVLGKEAKNVKEEDAMDYVLG